MNKDQIAAEAAKKLYPRSRLSQNYAKAIIRAAIEKAVRIAQQETATLERERYRAAQASEKQTYRAMSSFAIPIQPAHASEAWTVEREPRTPGGIKMNTEQIAAEAVARMLQRICNRFDEGSLNAFDISGAKNCLRDARARPRIPTQP